jgi:hypothetical protein
MARARNIKPGFFKNEDLGIMPIGARLLFIGLWTLADREGRLEDRPARITAEIFPYDRSVTVDEVVLWLNLLSEGFIKKYTVSGCKYIQIDNFVKHQAPHIKEQPSTIPAPEMPGNAGKSTGLPDLGSGMPGNFPALPGKGSDIPQPRQCVAPPDSLNPDSLNPDSLKDGGTPGTGWQPGEIVLAAWDRWGKHAEPQQVVIQSLMSRAIDWPRFSERWQAYCDYWDKHDWKYSKLTLWGWVEAGMPNPPREAGKSADPNRKPSLRERLEAMND